MPLEVTVFPLDSRQFEKSEVVFPGMAAIHEDFSAGEDNIQIIGFACHPQDKGFRVYSFDEALVSERINFPDTSPPIIADENIVADLCSDAMYIQICTNAEGVRERVVARHIGGVAIYYMPYHN